MRYFFLMLALVSCQSLPAVDEVYKKDLPMVENGITYHGTGVLDLKAEYHFSFAGRHNPERIRITTGHRVAEWIFQKKGFTWTFTPTPLEWAESILQFSFFDDKNRHQFGMMIFRAPDEHLKAKLYCNGEISEHEGTSVCQAEQNTIQGIDFYDPVRVVAKEGCAEPKFIDDNGLQWRWTMQKQYCIFIFKTRDGHIHRLVNFGYTDIVNP